MMLLPPHITPSRAGIIHALSREFQIAVAEVLILAAERGARMVPYMGTRNAEVQARLWRQSRSTQKISYQLSVLRKSSASKTAQVLDDVGSQFSRWATNALPGQSAHQYGLALDCFLIDEQGYDI